MRKTVLVCFALMLMGCQSKYKKMVDEIDKHNLKGVEKILKEDRKKLEEKEIFSLYTHAIQSYDNDEEGVEAFDLLNRYGLKRKEAYLPILCKQQHILKRVKYLMNYGEKLENSWYYCKENREVYDYFHLEIERLKEIEEEKKEKAIALKKKAIMIIGSPFSTSQHITITDVKRGKKLGEVTAHSARVDRINTGTFEFHGIFNISDNRATLKITDNTKFFFRDLKQEEAKKVFYETISKPSSYYLVVVDNDANIEEIRRLTSHIYYTAEELHNDIYPNERLLK